jgi:hypothetical protein
LEERTGKLAVDHHHVGAETVERRARVGRREVRLWCIHDSTQEPTVELGACVRPDDDENVGDGRDDRDEGAQGESKVDSRVEPNALAAALRHPPEPVRDQPQEGSIGRYGAKQDKKADRPNGVEVIAVESEVACLAGEFLHVVGVPGRLGGDLNLVLGIGAILRLALASLLLLQYDLTNVARVGSQILPRPLFGDFASLIENNDMIRQGQMLS